MTAVADRPGRTADAPQPSNRRWRTFGLAAYALLAYLPVLLTRPGRVDADTKTYLYLDPGRLLREAASMWDPQIGLGTVTHQTIGYLWPMGPFHWVLERGLHLPAWVAQRLWLGTLILLAGLGVRYLLRTLDVEGPGVPVAMLVYAFTPYVLEFSPRLSVILGPWAALGWMLGFTIRAMRSGGWRYPALLALTVQCVGGVNLTALLFAAIGPILWIPYAVVIDRSATWRRAWQVLWRTGLLTLITSLWWLIGLAIQSRYGLDILRFTESIETVSATSVTNEVLRGLGYWFFYGRDKLGLWNPAMVDFTQRPLAILVSYSIPALALLAAVCIRWRHRAYFVLSAVVAVVVAVAASPYDRPSLVGGVFKAFATGNTLGFAMRSTARAVPVMVLAFAVLIGAATTAAHDALRRRDLGWVGLTAAALVGVLVIVNAPGVWNGRYYSPYLERDEEVPAYWRAALRDLDARGDATRVLALPGADFAAYRWGMTVDPIEPGLMARPFVGRELVPWGSAASTNLLNALDSRVQDRLIDPDAIAPVARLMGAGDLLLRGDLQTDRFNLVSAEEAWRLLTSPEVAAGLWAPRRYGARIPGSLRYPPLPDPARRVRAGETPAPPVAVFGVADPEPILRAKDATAPVLVSGDGDGLVDLAASGLLDPRRAILYTAAFAGDRAALRAAVEPGTTLVVTDSNRRRGLRWSGMRANTGYTEQAGEEPLRDDLLDQRLDPFPEATDAARTVGVLHGGVRQVRATAYGSRFFGYSNTARPALALDGDVDTAWEVSGGEHVVAPDVLRIDLRRPVTTDHLGIVQPQGGRRGRWISRVGVRFDGGTWRTLSLPASTRRAAGGELRFGRTTFRTVELRIDGTQARAVGARASAASKARLAPVGFAEVRIRDEGARRDLRAIESVRLPTDLLTALGPASAEHALVLHLARADEELRREFRLPTAREFTVTGRAVLTGDGTDGRVDEVLGYPSAAEGGITVTARRSLPSLRARPGAAIDGDPTTAWRTRFDQVVGDAISVTTAASRTVTHLDLLVVNDGRHSLPTSIEVRGSDGGRSAVTLPVLEPADPATTPEGATVAVPVDLTPVTGPRTTVTITGARPVTVLDPVSEGPIARPVGIAELGLPGAVRTPLPATLPGTCRTDLVRIDDGAFGVRLQGDTEDALAGEEVDLLPCDPGQGVALSAGTHRVVARRARAAGTSVTNLVLASDADGGRADAAAVLTGSTAAPRLTAAASGRTRTVARIDGARRPTWVILGQSVNDGWHARIDGRDLGAPRLIDGFANGWRIPAVADGTEIEFVWTPQRGVNLALAASLAGVLACLGIVVATGRRRVAAAPTEVAAGPRLTAPWQARAGDASTVAGLLTALGCAVVAGAVATPWVGVVTGLFAAGAIRSNRVRAALRLAPVAIVSLIAVYVALGQWRHDYAPQFEWTTYFARARQPAWLALALLATDVVVGIVLARRPRDGSAG
ncbi:MAG: alpha-(1-_3)-arabinofuranosyltransferase family protein [Actinomycetes bacterium]